MSESAAGNALAAGASDGWVNDDPAPAVSEVFVAGSAWNANFLNFLGSNNNALGESAFGFRISSGAAQVDELPWVNLNRFSIRFNEPVNVAVDDLVVRGAANATYDINTFNYVADPSANGGAGAWTATWTLLITGVGPEKLLLDLDAGPQGVSDLNGNALDGEWTNPTADPGSGSNFASGDDVAGGDFQFRINVLPGDVNRSGGILGNDVNLVKAAQGFAPGEGLYTVFKDVNGSASILGNDVTLVRGRQGLTLPANEPVATSSSSTQRTFESPFASGASISLPFRTQQSAYHLLMADLEAPLVA